MFLHVFYFFNPDDFLKLVRIGPDRYFKFLGRPGLFAHKKIFLSGQRLNNYALWHNFWNLDEEALFYKLLPNSTLATE